MLSRANDDRLISLNISGKCILFYQIWQEMLDPRTLDVYQYRVMTSLSALIEMRSVIEKTLSGLFTTDANIEACRDELLYILNNDLILEKYYKPQLNRLRAALGEKPKTNAEKNKLYHQLGYGISNIQTDYMKYALDELKSSIVLGETNVIEKCANIIASQAVFTGWSARALSELLRFFKDDNTFEECWGKFRRSLLDESLQEHCVLINIPFRNLSKEKQQNTLVTLQRLGLDVKAYSDIVEDFAFIKDIDRLMNAEKRYLCVRVKAKDIYAAAHLAITEISEKLNFASFYNLIDAWDLLSVVILSINLQSTYHKLLKAEDLYSTHDYLDSSGRVFEDTRRIFAEDEKRTVRDRLQGSFGYTNISRASLFQEEKYMNLWVALESLARTNMYSDIISNIKETVPAALSLRYIYRIVRNYVEDCRRCQVRLDFSGCFVDMEQETKQKMVKETIYIFKTDRYFAELQDKCRVNTLLEKRTNDIRRLVTDISYAREKVENHYKHICWQIQRMYRIRNEIAHAALREQTSLLVYIDQLYHYLSSYISEIITCLSEKHLSTLEESLCLIRDNYDVFISLAKDHDSILIKENVLRTGIIDLISKM